MNNTLIPILFACTITFCGCNNVRIVGKAVDTKAGATCRTKNTILYLEGMDSWDARFLNKKVIVKGIRIDTIIHVKDTTTVTQFTPVKYVIVSPKFKRRGTCEWNESVEVE